MKDQKRNVGRREFAKTLAGAAALYPARSSRATVHPNPPGIKIAIWDAATTGRMARPRRRPTPSDEDLLFFQKAGVEYVSLPATPETANAESFIKMRERYESNR